MPRSTDRMCTPGFHGSTDLFLVSSRSAVRSVRGSKSEMDSAEKFRIDIYIYGQKRGPKICSHILYVFIYKKHDDVTSEKKLKQLDRPLVAACSKSPKLRPPESVFYSAEFYL